MPQFYLSPGVYNTEINLSQRVQAAASSTGAAVFESHKGALGQQFYTNRDDFLRDYGNPDPTVSFGHDCVLDFFTQSNSMWVDRVINGSTWAGSFVHNNTGDSTATSTYYDKFDIGNNNQFDGGTEQDITVLTFSGAIITANSITGTVTDGIVTSPVTIGPTVFATSNNATLTAFATAIQNAINSINGTYAALGGVAEVIDTGTANNRSIRVIAPQGVILTFTGLVITLGASQATISDQTGVKLFDVFAIGPGTYANGAVGFKTSGINQGIPSRYNISFSAALITSNVFSGTVNGFNIGFNQVLTLTFSTTLVTGNVFNATVNGVALTPINFTTDSATTMAAIATAIQAATVTLNPGSTATVSGNVITVTCGRPLYNVNTITGSVVTGGAGQATVTLATASPVQTNVIFSANNNQMLSDIATAIQYAMDINISTGGSTAIVSIPGSLTMNRQINVVTPKATFDLTFANLLVTSGSSQASVVVSQTLVRTPPNGTFQFQVFANGNVVTPVESYVVSMANQQDGFGNQQNIAQVINLSARASKYVRIWQPSTSLSLPIVTDTGGSIIFLANGGDGSAATSSNINAGWNTFINRDQNEIRILLNCGYTNVAVQQNIDALANSRFDCFGILDTPSNLQATTSATNYRLNTLNINSSYSGMYSPDSQIVDEFTDQIRFIPNSGNVGATFVFTDTSRATWFSPAGLNRGQIRNIQALRVDYEQGDRDQLSPNQVNAIIKKRGKGFFVFDDQTLSAVKSALSNINVRRLLIFIEVAITDALDFDLFEPDDDFLGFTIVQMLNDFLLPIQRGRGLFDFLVVSDDTNNSASDIDAGQRNVDIYLKPTLAARVIKVRTGITKTGANFSELVAAGGLAAVAG